MKPGRELDALIAENVMGLTKPKEDLPSWQHEYSGTKPFPLPYSTDIAAAWEVLDTLKALGCLITVSWTKKSKWHCYAEYYSDKDQCIYSEYSLEESASQAICLTALKMIEYMKNK